MANVIKIQKSGGSPFDLKDAVAREMIEDEAAAREASDGSIMSELTPLGQLQEKQATFNPYNNEISELITALSGDAWFTDYPYAAGYIKNICYRKIAAESGTVKFFIIDPETLKVLDEFISTSSSQTVTVSVNKRYLDRVYIAVLSQKIGYKADETAKHKSYYFNSLGVTIGSVISPTQYGKNHLSFYVEYDPIDEEMADLRRTVVGYESRSTFTINGVPIDRAEFNDSDPSWWASEYHYPAGYVDTIRLNPNAGAVPKIEIIDSVQNKVVFKGTAEDNIVQVQQMMEHDFYVLAKGVKYDTQSTPWQKYYNHASKPDSLDVGSLFTPTFSNGGYVFAVEITYKTVLEESLVLKKSGITKMFACGDSITAGFPYIPNNTGYEANEDLRWGRQVARRLGFDLTFGASSGNGWVYSTGSANAYSITQETDFSQYDVAVYAWGTNDYGHDIELGDVNDDPSEVLTVCSRIKWIINKVYTDNPGIVLILSLPLNRSDGNNHGTKETNWAYGTENGAGYTLGEMCEKIAELCTIHGVPYIDNRVSAFNRYSLEGLTVDGLHPNYRGYKILGAHMTGEIQRIVSPYYVNAMEESNP